MEDEINIHLWEKETGRGEERDFKVQALVPPQGTDRMRKTSFFITTGLSFFSLLLTGLLTASNAGAVEFYSLNSLHGISVRAVNSICRDSQGFTWASSKTGILRCSGDDCRLYPLPYESAGALTVRLNIENQVLTAYTNNGQLFVYQPLSDRFELLVNLRPLAATDHFELYGLLADAAGDYWLALNSGIYRYQAGRLECIEKAFNERTSITWYDERQLVYTHGGGIGLLDTRSLESSCLYAGEPMKGFVVSSCYLDREQDQLWMGTFSNGLYRYGFRSRSLSPVLAAQLPRQPILAIEQSGAGALLIGIDGQGIWELDPRGAAVLNVYKEEADDPLSLRGNGVYAIYTDPGKRVWIGTISGGLSFFEPRSSLITQIVHKTNGFNSLANNDVNALLEDRRGQLWLATNNGISCREAAGERWTHFYVNKLEQAQVFLTLCEDERGRIWAGSYSSGVYVLDGQSGKELAHYSGGGPEAGGIGDFIFDIYKDSQGDLWIGGVNGKISCYRSKVNQFRTYAVESISSFSELSPGQILLGCSNGLKLLDKQSGGIKNLAAGIVVQDLLLLNEEVWIATSGEGLMAYHCKSGKLRKLGAESPGSGLPSNFINSLVYADKSLWLGTESGLVRFDPHTETALTFSSVIPLSVISYNKSSVITLKNKRLAWGTNQGAVIFSPDSLRESSAKGRIFIQDLMVSGRSVREIPEFGLTTPIDDLKDIHLNYFQHTISVELIPMGVSAGARFSWKMEGLDAEWTAPTSNRIIAYTNIPSGRFELKIRLLDNSMTRVLGERSLAIRLVPPFWRTGWFWFLLLAGTSGIVMLSFLYYINQLKQGHAEEKLRFFTIAAHEIRTSLTLIKAPVEELNKETNLSAPGKYYLHLAIEQARRLSAVVTQLMDFQKADTGNEQLSLSMVDLAALVSSRRLMFNALALGLHIELVFNYRGDRYVTAIDESKMEKIIDNLVSNALKYSPAGTRVEIELKGDDRQWMLRVSDQGIGMTRDAQRRLFKEFYRGENAINSKVVGSGIGLLLVQKYVALHGGSVSCQSGENEGSSFEVLIPYQQIPRQVKALSPVDRPGIAAGAMKAPVQTPANPGEMSVLIVEDEVDLRNFISAVLGREWMVSTAGNGSMAWEMIQRQIPDIVVSDVMMPGMDGFELCRLIKSNYETSHVPVILLTALPGKADQLHGLGLGADDYLTKPFDMGLLIQRIKTIVHNREVVREKALKRLKGAAPEPVILENKLNDQFLSKIMELARLNIPNSGFSKDEFASSMNMSASLLYKKVKALTGLSPTDLIKTIRLRHAYELLQSRKYTVTEVSELCGFASVGYFSTVFRKHYDQSPTEVEK